MIVKAQDIVEIQSSQFEQSVDTETTGLRPYQTDTMFSIIIADQKNAYYINLKDYKDEGIKGLSIADLEPLKKRFEDPDIVWYLMNAKFDMHFLAQAGFFIKGKIYDLQFLDRIHYNQHQSYRLADVSKRWGDNKLDTVMAYITDNGLKSTVTNERLRKTEEKLHFDQVPFSVVAPYGEQDGLATLNVGKKILSTIMQEDSQIQDPVPKQMDVVENEARLVHTLFRMERRGIQIDIPYCNEAFDYYISIINDVERRFKNLTGLDFVKGTTVFEEVFASEKDKWTKTEKDQWCWDANIMEKFTNPAAKLVIEYAEAKKQSEYFANFLFHADANGVIHPSFKQAGTVTGRLSCMDPNLQNLSNPDKYEETSDANKYAVRRAFIPRKGFFFAMPDYSQVEFRMFLDVAKANNLINEILTGLDVHQATANVSGTTRKEAKTTNFLTVYGGGVIKLAQNLGYPLEGTRAQLGCIYKEMFGWRLSDEERAAKPSVTEQSRKHNEPWIRKAYDIQQSIFRSAPEIKDTIKSIQRTAESRGYVRNWLGRRYYFTDKKFSYKAPNHLIQGGSADVIKVAMNRVDDYLLDKKSKMLLSIHDELILEVAFGEEFVVDEVKKIMENVYPFKRLPLLVDVEYSYKNLADKESWANKNTLDGKTTGDSV